MGVKVGLVGVSVGVLVGVGVSVMVGVLVTVSVGMWVGVGHLGHGVGVSVGVAVKHTLWLKLITTSSIHQPAAPTV